MLARFLQRLNEPEKQRLLAVLAERYSDEVRDAALLQDAAGAVAQPLRRVLQRVLEREKRHAELLKEAITSRGGELPQAPEPPREASWREVLEAFESEKADYVRYLHDAYGAGDPELRGLLEKIAREEEQNYQDLLEVVSKLETSAD